MSPIGLYLHIPFCGSICSYCNFNRGLFDEDLKDRYVAALKQEIRRSSSEVRPRTSELGPRTIQADTIYFGGGTPSLLSPEEIASIIAACRSTFEVSEDAEVTLEANPETVTRERMAAYRDAGVNRVSMGVQSFRDEELKRLGRVHSADRARDALSATREAGIDNVSLDLMLWLPQQTVDDCLFSVRALADLQPPHASLYLLEVYPNSPLRDEMARAGWSLAPDEDAADMYLGAIEVLSRAGYRQYEISNFAKPGLESRHNMKYWTDGEWLAFGCGAHSTMNSVRWKNVSSTDAYIRAVAEGASVVSERRELSRVEHFQEAVFMGLRLTSGIDLSEIEQRYGVDLWHHYRDSLTRYVEAGLLVYEPASGNRGGRLWLTARGLLLSNEVMTVFLDEPGTLK